MKAYRTSSSQWNDAREREFTKLYNDNYSFVYNYVRFRMSGDDAAEDVVSEAFLHAARHFNRFDPQKAKFSTWVIKIASNVMISHWRKKRPSVALDDIPEAYLSQASDQDRVDERELVDHLLECLDETEREIVVMKYREGYRNVEIAEALDMNPSTVSTKLAAALSKMRARFERGM